MGNAYLQKIGRYAKERYVHLVLAVWIVWLIEFLNRNEWFGPIKWMFRQFPQFLLNTAVVFFLFLLLASLIGRPRIAFWVLSSVCFLLALISAIKIKILGVPLLPWDFLLTSETQDMAPYVKNIFTFKRFFGVALFVAVAYALLYRFPGVGKTIRWKERAIAAVVSLILLLVVYFDKPVALRQALHIENITWDQSENAMTNGFALSMMMNIEYANVDPLNGYGKTTIDQIIDTKPPKAGDKPKPDGSKPNLIIVLSESFWDITTLPGVSFDRDPLPNFHKLAKTYSSGTMLSPQFGGGTANVEFEVLTGNSMRFLPEGAVPYNQFINRPIDSLASIAVRQGYRATAISPFHNWYFNSRNVYRLFGFNKFISIEFMHPNYDGPYIADSEVAKTIIEETKRTPERDFVFANTMQNHFHYSPGKFEKNTFKAKVDGVSDETIGMLETYAQGVSAADNMLKTLVDYYKNCGEPTIIAFWGDHLPYLGDNYKAFKETGYISGEDDPDFLNKMHRVPLLVWNNFLPDGREDLNMSPSFLGPYLLELAGLSGTYYTDFLHDLSKRIPVIPPKSEFARMGIDENDLKEYEYLQYDIMFGEQHAYAEKGLKDKIVDPGFTLGLGPMTIEEVRLTPNEASSETKLIVRGQNIPPLAVVYWNDKRLETKWEKDGKLCAVVKADQMTPGEARVQVKVIDSKQIVVAESNVHTVNVQP